MRYLLLVISSLLLSSCALLQPTSTWHPAMWLPDSTRTVIVAKNFYAGSYSYKDRSDRRAAEGGTYVAKANAPVASGTSQAQDYSKAGQQGGALATGPGASAGATTRTGISNTTLVIIGIVVLILLLAGLAIRFRQKLAGLLKISV